MDRGIEEMMRGCEECIFNSEYKEYCDFGEGKIIKPKAANSDSFNMTNCPFFTRKSHYLRSDKEIQEEILRERRERASKYYI